ncbi:MAG TPA: hypothetical protein VH497_14155 [Vicinamibacterales bacterium]|jgi:hypothetical protein
MKVQTLFRAVVWLGILLNWSFALWALIAPAWLMDVLALGPLQDGVWLFNYSVLLAILSCFYIPAAKDPVRYRTSAWLMIVARLVPATTFFIGVAVHFMPPGFLKLGIGDASIGLLVLFLLHKLDVTTSA